MDIRHITFEEIYTVWDQYLWPNRGSLIEPYSMILYNTHPYEYSNDCLGRDLTFLGAYIDNQLVGVNSGHLINNTYRSRGLYVFNEFRGNNIGSELLRATVQCSIAEKAEFCWSLPRQTSIKSYLSAGFVISSEWFTTETSIQNAYVRTR